MADLVFAESFLRELSELPQVIEEAVWAKLSVVAQFPGVGSALLGYQLKATFGAGCLKITVYGYDVLYRRMDEVGKVQVLGIIHQRRVR